MIFTVSKEIIKNYPFKGHGYFSKAILYKVFDQQNKTGEFLRLNETCFFNYGDVTAKILERSSNLIKSKYSLIDEKKQAKIGEYVISGWTHQYGKLNIDNNVYYCEKLKPDVKYSLFKKKTWGHYKIQVSDGVSAVIYQFKLNEPFLLF